MSWGDAAPEVRFRISASQYCKRRKRRSDVPSANPNDSTTGIIDLMVKNDVPSFISSETILPLRLATTPYTFPRTSVEAWISQVYIASLIRGDQSSIPALHESRTEEIKAPTTAELFPRPDISYMSDIIRGLTLAILCVFVE